MKMGYGMNESDEVTLVHGYQSLKAYLAIYHFISTISRKMNLLDIENDLFVGVHITKLALILVYYFLSKFGNFWSRT
jgi:hypothetical protein